MQRKSWMVLRSLRSLTLSNYDVNRIIVHSDDRAGRNSGADPPPGVSIRCRLCDQMGPFWRGEPWFGADLNRELTETIRGETKVLDCPSD